MVLGMASLLTSLTASALEVKYYRSSDSCQGNHDGAIVILSDSNGNPVCKKFQLRGANYNDNMWAISIDGVCEDISDTHDAQDICNNYLK